MNKFKPYTIILGATGSIGMQALRLLKKQKNIKVIGIACKTNKELAKKIENEFNVEHEDVYISSEDTKSPSEFLDNILTKYPASEVNALNAVNGFDGLKYSILLAEKKIDTLLANKESVVAGGKLYLNFAKKNKIKIIPVDSEHSCIYTLTNRFKRDEIKKVLITCSGGKFLHQSSLNGIKPEDAIKNPNWSMGKKISVDSNTLSNKVAEVIEAKNLFNLKANQIQVVIHENSMIHSMIQLKNNSYFAEISKPDMTLAISKAYSLNKYEAVDEIDWDNLNLKFSKPNARKFPFLALIDELVEDPIKCIIFNASNEVAVEKFLSSEITFEDIYKIVKRSLELKNRIYDKKKISNFDDVFFIDKKTRELIKNNWM